MTRNDRLSVHLEFTSGFHMIDVVQTVGDYIGRQAGLDDDAVHWVGVAVRECVINAIKHGNENDPLKLVFVDFQASTNCHGPALEIRVRDQGKGFDPSHLADPLAPENILKSSGRGIFLIRNFMDDVRLQRVPDGGMEIVMTKRAQPAGAADSSINA